MSTSRTEGTADRLLTPEVCADLTGVFTEHAYEVDAVVAAIGSLPSGPPASTSPLARAISMIAVPRCSRQPAVTGVPSGPVTVVVRLAPPSASSNPSPPSASASSVLMVSMSEAGFTAPSTCTTSESANPRTTCAMASASRMFARNWLPSPSPSLAPLTMPAMSTNDTVAGRMRSLPKMPASTPRRTSGRLTMPMLGSIVANG